MECPHVHKRMVLMSNVVSFSMRKHRKQRVLISAASVTSCPNQKLPSAPNTAEVFAACQDIRAPLSEAQNYCRKSKMCAVLEEYEFCTHDPPFSLVGAMGIEWQLTLQNDLRKRSRNHEKAKFEKPRAPRIFDHANKTHGTKFTPNLTPDTRLNWGSGTVCRNETRVPGATPQIFITGAALRTAPGTPMVELYHYAVY